MDYVAQLRYTQHLAQLKRERVAAVLLGKTHCVRCGMCCYHSPAQLRPDDVARLARHEGISDVEYFQKHCAVSYINGQLSTVLLRTGQNYGGRLLPENECLNLITPCHYLTDKGCSIHEHKPLQCTRAKCWKPNRIMQMAWSEEELKTIGFNATHGEP